MSAAIALPAPLRDRMLAHALSSPDLEVCGLLGARDNGVRSLYPIPNVADDPAIRFFMEPHAQVRALRTMRATGEELFAIYHSHPRSEAAPSPTDLAQAAYPGTYYLIVSLLKRDAPELRGYLFNGRGFREVDVRVT